MSQLEELKKLRKDVQQYEASCDLEDLPTTPEAVKPYKDKWLSGELSTAEYRAFLLEYFTQERM